MSRLRFDKYRDCRDEQRAQSHLMTKQKKPLHNIEVKFDEAKLQQTDIEQAIVKAGYKIKS